MISKKINLKKYLILNQKYKKNNFLFKNNLNKFLTFYSI